MGKKEKLISRLKSKPRDFTFDEMEALLLSLGFKKCKAGKTSGSRVRYIRNGVLVLLHKPHPGNILKPYQIREALSVLRKEGLI
ncbi:MAG: type II toxin-antitoxin system HicA family toxin [Defluviitaleaceae bacterium]|nr:type II toxin-antitoxin system HicA family toxin [Defluviitaleaceae bacterium]